MAVDRNPAEGRIILGIARSTAFYRWPEQGGVITRVSGQRVYYTDKESGKEKFLHEYSVICDTQEEADLLLDFSVRAMQKVAKLHLNLETEHNHLIDVINARPDTSEETKVVKRSRRRS